MCKHRWKKIEDVMVCVLCGVTVAKDNGAVMFDRNLSNVLKQKERRKRRRKS